VKCLSKYEFIFATNEYDFIYITKVTFRKSSVQIPTLVSHCSRQDSIKIILGTAIMIMAVVLRKVMSYRIPPHGLLNSLHVAGNNQPMTSGCTCASFRT
jgi:hypothetical protein